MSPKPASNRTRESSPPALVPKLRFPEFRGDGGWEELSLSDVSKVQNKKIPVQKLNITDYISTENLLPDFSGVTCASNLPNVNSVTEFLPDDILLANIRPYLKKAWSATRKGGASNDVIVFRSRDNVKQRFLSIRIRSDAFIDYVMSGAKGVKMPRGDVAQMKTFPFPLPEPAEQQKIAECLGSLDDLITAHSAKLEALQDHKKGLLQKLFPAEGQTTPKLRFPGFEGEWEERPLGKWIEEYRENSISENQYEVLTSSRQGLIRQKDYYDNTRLTDRSNLGFNIIPPDYVTYRSRSDDRRFYFNENTLGITGVISIYYPVFRIKNGVNKFFIELFSHYQELIGRRSIGTSQTVLSITELKKIKLPIPDKAEQQKIATCLSSLDDQIAAQTDQIAALKEHKQGLMQQLFPNPEGSAA